MANYPSLYNPTVIQPKNRNKLTPTKAETLWLATDAQSAFAALHSIHQSCHWHGSHHIDKAQQLSSMMLAVITHCERVNQTKTTNIDTFGAAERLKTLVRGLLVNVSYPTVNGALRAWMACHRGAEFRMRCLVAGLAPQRTHPDTAAQLTHRLLRLDKV